jgi:hypothetical protein
MPLSTTEDRLRAVERRLTVLDERLTDAELALREAIASLRGLTSVVEELSRRASATQAQGRPR